MQQTEWLYGTLVNGHFSAKEIGPGCRDLYAQAALDSGAAEPVDFYEAGKALTDKCSQRIITHCREPQRLSQGQNERYAMSQILVFDASSPAIGDNGRPFFERLL